MYTNRREGILGVLNRTVTIRQKFSPSYLLHPVLLLPPLCTNHVSYDVLQRQVPTQARMLQFLPPLLFSSKQLNLHYDSRLPGAAEYIQILL